MSDQQGSVTQHYPLVEIGSNGELTIYVREPSGRRQGQRHGRPVTGSPPSIAEKPNRIAAAGIRVNSTVVEPRRFDVYGPCRGRCRSPGGEWHDWPARG
jgi:hypothetical protein